MKSRLENIIIQLKANDSHFTSLKVYVEGGIGIDAENARYLSEALSQNHTLTSLHLGVNNNIGVEGARHLSEALSQNHTLTSLNLSTNNIGVEGARHLFGALSQNHTLTSVNLGRNDIGAEGARHLSEALSQNHTLTSLGLEWNDVGAEGARHLSEALSQNHTLTSLNLRGNNIGTEGARHLSEALSQTHTLTSLDLEWNHISDEGARHLSEALSQNHTLTSLYLGSWNFISAGSALHLSEALSRNHTLTSLNLRGNYIGVGGARHLFGALSQNQTLTSLDLQSNHIGDEDARHLSEALSQNHTLTSLNLRENNISADGERHLSEALSQNHTLISLNLKSQNLTLISLLGRKKIRSAILEEKLSINAVIHYMMGHLSYLNDEQTDNTQKTLNTLGLGSIHLPLPLHSELRPFLKILLTDLTQASRQRSYTVMILPFSYARQIDLLQIFFSLDSADFTLWLSKEGFCFPLTKDIDHKVMEHPYLWPEWNVLFDPKTAVEDNKPWIDRLSYAMKTLYDHFGFLPNLSFQYTGITDEDLRDLLAYLAQNPPIKHLDLSHNPVMLKNWNKNKTEKMIHRNSVFNCLHQLTENTQLCYLNLSHTEMTLDQKDYPKLLSIFSQHKDLVIDVSGNYVSSYMRWKPNGEKEKTSKALCRFFQKLPPDDGALKNDPLKDLFNGLRFVRTQWIEESFFQAIALCLNQDAKELKESFKAAILEHANTWKNYLEKEDSIETYLSQVDSGKRVLPLTLTFMGLFLNRPLVIFSSDQVPVISKEHSHLPGSPIFLYWEGNQEYHALVYKEHFDGQDLLNRVISAMQLGISVFYDKRRTQSEYSQLHHGFWAEIKPTLSVFSVLPKFEGLTLSNNGKRHVAICCLDEVTGGHTWMIIEGKHHYGQEFFVGAELTTVDNRTTQINIHADFCPHRFKKGLRENKIFARVYPNQPKDRIKFLLKRIEEEHERSHYRYGSTGTSSLIASSQQLSKKTLSEEEQKNKTINCMQWAIERLLEYEIIESEEAKELSGKVLRYWPINLKESKPCCVM